MIVLAFAGIGAVANAQTTSIETPSKYTVATNSFWSNWYVQVGVDMTVQDPRGAKFFDDMMHAGRTYGIDLAVGKWFTPGLGLRLKANWENGLFYRALRNTDHVWTPSGEKGGYGAIYGDVQFNLSNMICGYNENRVWNMIVFPRAGVARNFERNSYAPVLGLGAQSMWRINKLISVYAEAAYNAVSSDFAGVEGDDKIQGYVDANIGVQFNLGKTGFTKAVSIDAYNALAAASEEALARLRADLDRERALNADLRAQLAKWQNHKCPTAEATVANAAASVFFNINSSKINSKKDLINLESIASTAKSTGAKVVVTGNADSKTGSSAYNQKLSEARAQAVADELVNLGVSRDKIEAKGVGGVNNVTPYNLNRRAIIELK